MREESTARLNYQTMNKTICIRCLHVVTQTKKCRTNLVSWRTCYRSESRRYPVSVEDQLRNIFKCRLDDDELTRVVASGFCLVELMIDGVQLEKNKRRRTAPGLRTWSPTVLLAGLEGI